MSDDSLSHPASSPAIREKRAGRHAVATTSVALPSGSASGPQAFYELAFAGSGVLDPEHIANLAVAETCRALDVDGAILWRWNSEAQLLQSVARQDSRGQADELGRDRQAGEGLSGETFARQVPLVTAEYLSWNQAPPDVTALGVKSAAAAPLLIGGRAIGVLVAYTYRPHSFAREQVAHLVLLAGQVAPTLEAAHLHARLEQEDGRLRRAYDAMACGVHVRGRSRELLFENQAAVRILGRTGSEAPEVGRNGGWTFVDENGRHLPESAWPASVARRTGEPQHNEVAGLRFPDGRTVWLRLDSVPVLDEAGEVKEVVTSFYDVTEERLAMASLRESQERLRTSRERYRMIADTAHEGIWMFDAQGRITYANRRMCEITSRTQDELLGRTIGDVFGASHQHGFDRAMAKRRLGLREELEITFTLKDGTQRWAHVSASGVFDGAGNLTGTVGMWTDITERKQTEQALKLSEERYRTIVETAEEGIWTLDPAGTITFANRRMCEIVGRDETDLLGHTVWNVFGHPGAKREFEKRLPDRRRGLREEFEVSFRLKDGAWRSAHISSSGMFDGTRNLTGLVEMVTDVTERRRTERALKANEERYRTIVETAQEGIWILDSAGSIAFANKRLAAMLGYSHEELIGQPVWMLLGAGNRAGGFGGQGGQQHAGAHRDVKLQRKDGSTIWAMVSSSPLMDGEGQVSGALGMLTDISGRKQAEESLAHQALHDSLTGLPNRVLLQDRLTQAIQMAQRGRSRMALLVLDLDRFKQVNDTLGHRFGDGVLKAAGPRLESILRQSDTVARLGGDEFAIVLPGVRDLNDAIAVADKISEALAAPLAIDGRTLEVGASIGIALCPDHGLDDQTLLRRADMAMYVAKRERTGHAVYVPEHEERSPGELMLASELRAAIAEGQLELFYQPKVSIAAGDLVGLEALVRWRHPTLGLIAPDRFIALAEDTGLIRPLTEWVADAAIQQCARWHKLGWQLTVAINLSMHNLRDPHTPDMIRSLLDLWKVPADLLKVEITESTIMAAPLQTLDVLTKLFELGVNFAIDDFGTGYSSLAYLKRLPAHEIKIDKSFVFDILTDENDEVIVRSVIDLAHNLGRLAVAEGVESAAILNKLAAFGCDIAQGYYIARPMPPAELEPWIFKRLGPSAATHNAWGTSELAQRLLNS